jgi:hypothetical protein
MGWCETNTNQEVEMGCLLSTSLSMAPHFPGATARRSRRRGAAAPSSVITDDVARGSLPRGAS